MNQADVNLKGNTNFVVLKDLNNNIVVPRTNLAAVDLTAANGIGVTGNTIYAVMATASDIQSGTSGSLVTPNALKPILDGKQNALEAGTGIEIVASGTASTISVSLTDVETLIDGTTATKIVDVAALRGALTTGQAVDVTSVPDQTINGNYRGTFTTTSTTLGFASFPKYAAGLQYLMIADVTVTQARNITPSGTWLDGSTSAKALAANTSTRVAMLFNAANKGKFTFSGSGTVTVSNLREYEVTACTAESIAYIASLSNPDAFADYYLVKADMVQPWTYIIDMGTSPAVTIAAGLSYKLNASTGTHALTVDTCPAGYDGRDAIIRITLGGTGVVQAVAPLQLGDALVPYAINNCVVKFRDGEAVLLVEDTLAGYVVTVTSGTGNGSLAYGLAATGIPYIAFSTGTDGSVVDMGNAVTANEEVTVVGNGYTSTTITGNITCTNKTTVANLSLQDVTIAGGTMTLGDAYIPSGSTVSVSAGGLAIENVSGNSGTINLGGNSVSGAGSFSGITLSSGTLTSGHLTANGDTDINMALASGTTLTLAGTNRIEQLVGSVGAFARVYGADTVMDFTGNTNSVVISGVPVEVQSTCSMTVLLGETSGTVASSYVLKYAELKSSTQLTNTGELIIAAGDAGNAKCYGYASGAIVRGGYFIVRNNARCDKMTAVGGGYIFMSSGVIVRDCVASSGGYIRGRASAIDSNSLVLSGGKLWTGGTTESPVISSGGTMLLEGAGGVANNAVIMGSAVLSSGLTTSAVIHSGGSVLIRNGAIASSPVISSGGILTVSSGGQALLVTSMTGAVVTVRAGGTITYI